MSKTIFEKIIDRELPSNIVYEDDKCIAIEDSRESALSAHHAKISCIAFPGSFHEEDNYDFCSKIMLKLDTSIFN